MSFSDICLVSALYTIQRLTLSIYFPSLLSSKLRSEWEERVKVIGSLEQSLAEVQETFSQREANLTKEKEEAVQRTGYDQL